MSSKMVLSFISLPEVYESSSHSTPLLTFGMASLSHFSFSKYLIVVFKCIFLMLVTSSTLPCYLLSIYYIWWSVCSNLMKCYPAGILNGIVSNLYTNLERLIVLKILTLLIHGLISIRSLFSLSNVF